MGSSDLSTDRSMGSLTPASAVRAVEEHAERAANQNVQHKARRRPGPDEDELEEIGASSEASELPPHTLDDMA